MAGFTKGDLLDFGNGALYHVKGFDYLNSRVEVTPSQAKTGTAPSFFTSLVIVKSGRNNQLNTDAGQLTVHSQSTNISLPEVDDPNRLIGNTNSFINDLNQGVTAAGSGAGSGSFILSGTYADINVSSFVAELPPACAADIASATIRNLQFNYETTANGELILKIMSFEVQCSDQTWEKVIGDQIAI